MGLVWNLFVIFTWRRIERCHDVIAKRGKILKSFFTTQKLSIRFHERSKGSNNMKYINKDLDDFVFKKLFDGQGSEVDFVFPVKKYTYIQKDWVDIDSKLSQNWVDNESSIESKTSQNWGDWTDAVQKRWLCCWDGRQRKGSQLCIAFLAAFFPALKLSISWLFPFFFGSILLDCVKLWLYTLVLKDRYFSYI